MKGGQCNLFKRVKKIPRVYIHNYFDRIDLEVKHNQISVSGGRSKWI